MAMALWFLIICVAPSSADVASYYFSSLRGDDGNDGISPDAPWRHLTRLNQVSSGGLPYTNVLLERGSDWFGEPLFIPFIRDGIVGAYGNDTLPQPAIWGQPREVSLDPGAQVAAAASVCLELLGPRNVTVSGLHLASCYHGIKVVSVKGVTSAGVTIETNSFADIRTPYGATQPTFNYWGAAVWYDLSAAESAVTNFTLRSPLPRLCSPLSLPGT
jgi:hypothetical protein